MVRIITCWCLARYTQWILQPPQGEGGPQQVPVSPEAEVRELLVTAGISTRESMTGVDKLCQLQPVQAMRARLPAHCG